MVVEVVDNTLVIGTSNSETLIVARARSSSIEIGVVVDGVGHLNSVVGLKYISNKSLIPSWLNFSLNFIKFIFNVQI